MKKTITLLSVLIAFIFTISPLHAQQRERLVAHSQYNAHSGVFLPYDSITYIYSGARGVDSIWTYPVQAFDSSFTWYNKSTGGAYIYQKQVQAWNGNILLADTIFFMDTATSAYSYVNYLSYSYYPGGLSAGYITYGWDSAQQTWDSTEQTIWVYDTTGNPTVDVTLGLRNSAWDTTSIFRLTYNSSNLLTRTIDLEWPFSNNQEYGYLSLFSYNNLGQMDTSIEYYLGPNDSIWQRAYMAIDTYGVSGYLTTALQLNPYDTTGWSVSGRYTYSYDANNNLISNVEQVVDSNIWVNYWRNIRSYDSYNMITSYERDNWDTTTSAWIPGQDLHHYYYQLYTPDTTTGITPMQSADLRIYPVPASSMLTLDLTWCEAQSSTATIYDATGRRCGAYPLPCTASYHGYVPIGSLPAGIYTVVVRGATGSVTKVFDIMR